MADFPGYLPTDASEAGLARALDREGKIPRAVEALGAVAGRDVVLIGGGELRAAQLADLGARVTTASAEGWRTLPPDSADVVVSFWAAFSPERADWPDEVRDSERVVRPHGRVLAVHDYGRDDVGRLLADPDRERRLVAWSDRRGPFLGLGFRVRVLHCWWTFDSLEDARRLLVGAFGPPADDLAASMTRPRLSHKVAVYHRTVADAAARDG